MTYWVDLFTGTTWDEFRTAGARLSGFRSTVAATTKRIQPGDVLLCYVTGVKRWVGTLEVIGPSTDTSPIWRDDEFPIRFEVKPIVLLDPVHGVPMDELMGRASFFASDADRGLYRGIVRKSPAAFPDQADGKLIQELLHQAGETPVARPVSAKLLARKPYYFKVTAGDGEKTNEAVVSIPEPEFDEPRADEDDADAPLDKLRRSATRHVEIQYHLLRLGHDMGFNVWVARNDRSREWKGSELGRMPGAVTDLPTQFNEATNRTIELIDVLWLKGNSIVSAFEIECTTSVYSGLLRMSDLLALQPNLNIPLFLVAPDERREKVQQEITRPTFTLRERPLAKVCGFLAFSNLMEKLEGVYKMGIVRSLKPDFLEAIAEYFDREAAWAK